MTDHKLVRPDASTEQSTDPKGVPVYWPEQTVAPQKPLDPRRMTLSERRNILGRVEPHGA